MVIGIVLSVILLYLIYAGVSMLIPPLFHHKLPENYSFVSDKPASKNEKALCIDDNREALVWRLRLIEEAKEELVISTFDWAMDDSGKDVTAAIIQAANRGVRVRLIVDGMNSFLKLRTNPYFHALIGIPNVEAKFYNPINLLVPWKWNYRLHDKYFIADDYIYILGGRNLNNLFLGDYPGHRNYDRDILVCEEEYTEDTSLASLYAYFDKVWNSGSSVTQKPRRGKAAEAALAELTERYETLKTAYPEAYTEVDWAGVTHPVGAIRLLTNPINAGNKDPECWAEVLKLMDGGKDISIQTPYLVCNKTMFKGLTDLCTEDSKVRLAINAPESGANPFGCTDYLNKKKDILASGMDVYTYAYNASMHTKTILVDESVCLVGSFNIDMRSVYIDTEMMLYIDDKDFNEHLRGDAQFEIDHSAHVLPDGSKEMGAKYTDVTFTASKKVIYTLLRIIIRPIRHLL